MIRCELEKNYQKSDDSLFLSGDHGYWSNLDRVENDELVASLGQKSTKEAIREYYPDLFDVIFSSKREAGLELLELKGDEACVDLGCMWGALTIPLARRCKHVLGIDQTLNSLKFLGARAREEELDNVDLLCANLKRLRSFDSKFDVAVVNGVLEWIPEEGPIELKSYYGKFSEKKYSADPRQQQLDFLRTLHGNLSDRGKLYLAIENRYDYKMFIGFKDPHANLHFVSFLPRRIANWISKWRLGRPYVTWIYSFNGLKKLIKEAGFSKVDLYMCFPDYRFPEKIIPLNGSLKDLRPQSLAPNIVVTNVKRNIFRRIVGGIYRKLFARILRTMKSTKYLAPSIIAIGHK